MSIELVDPSELDKPFTRSFRVKLEPLLRDLEAVLFYDGVIDEDEEVDKIDLYTGDVRIYVKKKQSDQE